MADSYTSQGFTKPEPGGSLNTWGAKLNVVIDMMAAQNKFAEVQIAGATSVSFTNASASATALPTGLKLTANGVTAAFAFTLPSGVPYKWLIWNMTGYTATISCGGAASISLETGHSIMVAYSDDDGDIAIVTPSTHRAGIVANGIISAVTAGTLATHAVNKGQMEAAIAVLAGVITGGLALVSSADTSAGYLIAKLLEGAGIDITLGSAGANETLTFAVDLSEIAEFIALTGTVTATITNSSTPMTAKRRYIMTGTGPAVLPSMVAGDWVEVVMAQANGIIGTIGRNSQTIDGVAADDSWTGTGVAPYPVWRYYYASAGAVKSQLMGAAGT